MTEHKTEQNEARTELLATLALLIPAVDGVGVAEPLELGEARSTIQNVLVAMQEYLNAELQAEKVIPHKQRPDIDSWLATETNRLVSNTVAAYQVGHIDVLQIMSSHLIAGAATFGAMAVAEQLAEAEADDCEPESDPFAVSDDWQPDPEAAALVRRIWENWSANKERKRPLTANETALKLGLEPALVARLFRLFETLDSRVCKHWLVQYQVPFIALERIVRTSESKDNQWAAYLELVGGPETEPERG